MLVNVYVWIKYGSKGVNDLFISFKCFWSAGFVGAEICNVAVPFTNVLKRWTAFLQRCTTLDKVYQCCTTWNAQLCYNVAQRCITFGNVVTALNNVWQRCYNVALRCITFGSVAQRWTMAALYNLKRCTALIQQRTALLQRWITFGNGATTLHNVG